MKKFLSILLAAVLLIGCSQNFVIHANAASYSSSQTETKGWFASFWEWLFPPKEEKATEKPVPQKDSISVETNSSSDFSGNTVQTATEIVAQQNQYTPEMSITAKIDALKPLMDGKYWNGGKNADQLISAVDAGEMTEEALGITNTGCKSSSRNSTPPCTSNAFKYGLESVGRQCNGFSKFIAYYLFGTDGDVSTWQDCSGSNVYSVALEPGDRIGRFDTTNGKYHHAIVWKVEDGKVYVVECLGTYSTRHDGCLIHFGYYNGVGDYALEGSLKEYLATVQGGYVQKHPDSYGQTTSVHTAPILSVSSPTLPTTLKQGSNFGLRGTIETDCGVITSVYGEIADLHGNVIQSGQHHPNKPSDNLRNSINNDLSFGQLSAGSYVYRVWATAKNGSKETTQPLIDCQFQVQGESSAPTMPAPTESVAVQKPTVWLSSEKLPADMQQGSNFGLRGTVSTDCGVITHLYGGLIDAAGNEVQCGHYYPNTSSVDLRYTINNDLKFGNLSSGQYTYCVEATAQNGNEQTKQNLIRHSFQVYSTSVAEPALPQTPVVTEPVQTTPPAPTVPARTPVLSVSGHNLPESQKVGQNFGIRGTVSTDCGTITELYGAIIDASGNAVCSGWYNPYSTTVDLRTTINNDLVFGTLGVGSYTYYVQARAENNGQQAVKSLIEHSFTVGAASESQQSEPALNSVGYNMTVNVGKGSTLRFCSTVSTADQYEIGSLPNGATVYVYGTTQQQYEGRTWAKISYNGTDGWVNYKWLY